MVKKISRSAVRYDVRVEGQLHDLRVAGRAGTHLPVGRIRDVTAGVAGHHVLDAVDLLVDRLEAPETAAAEGCLRCGRHDGIDFVERNAETL